MKNEKVFIDSQVVSYKQKWYVVKIAYANTLLMPMDSYMELFNLGIADCELLSNESLLAQTIGISNRYASSLEQYLDKIADEKDVILTGLFIKE